MSYEEILETTEDGRFRVKLVLDEYPAEPYDDGQSPLMRIDHHRAEHIMATGRPTDSDDQIEGAISYWHTCPADSNWRLFEKYLRAFHGVTKIETWHSGSYWYVTYDPAAWREHVGAAKGSVDMSEYRAWCEGDVWGYVVQKRVTWRTDDPDYADEERWEATDDSCWGFYGSDGANGKYLRETALEALRHADEPYAHMSAAHEIRPDFLSRWDRDTVTAKHARYHEFAGPDLVNPHTHDNPDAPFAVAGETAEAGLSLTPEQLAAAVEDMRRVQRNLDADREAGS